MTPALVPLGQRDGRGRYGRWRRISQGAVALFFVALPFLATTGLNGTFVATKLGPLDLVEPSTAAAALLASRALAGPLVLAVVPLVALAIVLGPVYCSWACPFGLVSELLDRVRTRGNGGRWIGNPAASARRSRFVLLALLLAASLLLGFPVAALLAPPRLATALPLELRAAGDLPGVTSALLGLALALDLLGPRRVVCRALCPAGTAAALLRQRTTLAPRFHVDACRCSDAAPCFQACPWGIDPRSMRTQDGCTTCLACIDRCPAGALSLFLPSSRS